MPLYIWKCNKCGKEVEVLRSFADYLVPPEEVCTECRSDDWCKIIKHTGVQMKRGPNWGPGSKGNW